MTNWLCPQLSYLCFFEFVIWQVIDEFDQNIHFLEIDIEEDPEIAEAAGIMGTPCVQFFKNKEMIRSVKICPFLPFALSVHDIHSCFLFSVVRFFPSRFLSLAI